MGCIGPIYVFGALVVRYVLIPAAVLAGVGFVVYELVK